MVIITLVLISDCVGIKVNSEMDPIMEAKLKVLDVCDGERRLLDLLKSVRRAPDVSISDMEWIRRKTLHIMLRVTKGLNRQWHANEEVWSIVYVQMEHCHQIFGEILRALHNRYLGEPIVSPIVEDAKTQTEIRKIVDVSTSTNRPLSWQNLQINIMAPININSAMVLSNLTSPLINGQRISSNEANMVSTANVSVREEEADFELHEDVSWVDEYLDQENVDNVDRSNLPRQDLNHDAPDVDLRRSSNVKRMRTSQNALGMPNCFICGKDHAVHACEVFLKMSRPRRYVVLANQGVEICHNCFCVGHSSEVCWKPDGCRCYTRICQCGGKHPHNSTICSGKRVSRFEYYHRN